MRVREPVELAQLEVLALPQRPSLGGAVSALGAHRRLEPVREPGPAQAPRRAQVGEQVVGAAAERRAADQRQQAAPEARVSERDPPVDRVGDAVGAEHLLEQRGVLARAPKHNGDVAGLDPLAQQLQDARSGQLDLGALAARAVERDRRAGIDGLARLLEQPPLQLVQRGARRLRVVLVNRIERPLLGAAGEQLLPDGGGGPEGLASGLEGQRDRDVRAAAAGDRLERIQLERREVVEAVNEQGGAAPGGRVGAQGIERPPGEQLRVHEPGLLEAGAVAPVDGRDLLGVRPPRPVAAPVTQRAGEPGRVDHRAAELGHEARSGPGEAGLGGRFGEHAEAGAAHRFLDDQLALDVRGDARVVARAPADLLEQPAEAQHACPEHGAPLGQLALGVLDVAERRDEEDRVAAHPVEPGACARRLVVEARPQPAQHLARLGGVRGTGYECERHTDKR